MEKLSRLATDKMKTPARTRKKQKRKPRVGKLAHELLNQMSVMQLSCFSLRQQLQKNPAINLRHLDAIEKTLSEAAELANTIQSRLANSTGDDNERTAEVEPMQIGSKANVYPFPKPSSTG
ncbi:MAG: hypothetical protein FJ145_15095 [Deltaproteobacteria bacterium]|nr:hypothetical protein [Deltaproteobacteria bacterium]